MRHQLLSGSICKPGPDTVSKAALADRVPIYRYNDCFLAHTNAICMPPRRQLAIQLKGTSPPPDAPAP
jgi:hypothetical protein